MYQSQLGMHTIAIFLTKKVVCGQQQHDFNFAEEECSSSSDKICSDTGSLEDADDVRKYGDIFQDLASNINVRAPYDDLRELMSIYILN